MSTNNLKHATQSCGSTSTYTTAAVETQHTNSDCGCGCDTADVFPIHEHEHEHENSSNILLRMSMAAVLTFTAIFLQVSPLINTIIFILAYLISGYDILLRAAKNIIKGSVFDEHFLMSIATIGAIILGEYSEGIAVMVFYQIGEYFQGRAVRKSRKSISDLMDINPEFANKIIGDNVVSVTPSEVELGDILLVRTGEKIPVDGVIVEGTTQLNTSSLTGESLPVSVSIGDEVLSGSINTSDMIKIKATAIYNDSTVARILRLVSEASAQKSKSERFITKFARYYTPIVVYCALALAIIPSLVTGDFNVWIYRALTFLVISCPCALVVSVPLSFFSGIGAASKHGILMKGGIAVEKLAKCKTVVFDKTGTITTGKFSISEIKPLNISEEELVSLAATPQQTSTHPIAKALLAYSNLKLLEISEAKDIAGRGVSAVYNGKKIFAGSSALMADCGIYDIVHGDGTAVHIAIDGEYMGVIFLQDNIKPEANEAVDVLQNNLSVNTALVTGDNEFTAKNVAKSVGIATVYASQLPHDKMDRVKEYIKASDNGTTVFVGDGINDAPVLSLSDVGIAMGGIGSDAAIEAADVVIMSDELTQIAKAINISKKTMAIVVQNVVFSIGIKVVVMFLGALGLAGMWSAVFADVGVTFLAVLNSIRALRQ